MVLEVQLHRSLYDGAAVARVAQAYGGVAQVEVQDGEHEVLVRFNQVDPDVADVLLDHFCNHVLVETITARNQSEAVMSGKAG